MNDPVATAVIAALARRAAAQQGLARQLMLQRVAQLQAAQVPAAAAAPATPTAPTTPQASLASLAELVNRLGRAPGTALPPSALPRAAPAPLKAVAAFKGTWSRLRAEQRLRQALAQVPAQAGPLNSSHVVHRALQALHGLSPAYLDAFMLHIDTLLWLDQASGGDLPQRPATRAQAGQRGGTPPR